MKKIILMLVAIVAIVLITVLRWDYIKFSLMSEKEREEFKIEKISEYIYDNHLDDCEKERSTVREGFYSYSEMNIDGENIILVEWGTSCMGNRSPSVGMFLDIEDIQNIEGISYFNEDYEDGYMLYFYDGSRKEIIKNGLYVKSMNPTNYTLDEFTYIYDYSAFRKTIDFHPNYAEFAVRNKSGPVFIFGTKVVDEDTKKPLENMTLELKFEGMRSPISVKTNSYGRAFIVLNNMPLGKVINSIKDKSGVYKNKIESNKTTKSNLDDIARAKKRLKLSYSSNSDVKSFLLNIKNNEITEADMKKLGIIIADVEFRMEKKNSSKKNKKPLPVRKKSKYELTYKIEGSSIESSIDKNNTYTSQEKKITESMICKSLGIKTLSELDNCEFKIFVDDRSRKVDCGFYSNGKILRKLDLYGENEYMHFDINNKEIGLLSIKIRNEGVVEVGIYYDWNYDKKRKTISLGIVKRLKNIYAYIELEKSKINYPYISSSEKLPVMTKDNNIFKGRYYTNYPMSLSTNSWEDLVRGMNNPKSSFSKIPVRNEFETMSKYLLKLAKYYEKIPSKKSDRKFIITLTPNLGRYSQSKIGFPLELTFHSGKLKERSIDVRGGVARVILGGKIMIPEYLKDTKGYISYYTSSVIKIKEWAFKKEYFVKVPLHMAQDIRNNINNVHIEVRAKYIGSAPEFSGVWIVPQYSSTSKDRLFFRDYSKKYYISIESMYLVYKRVRYEISM